MAQWHVSFSRALLVVLLATLVLFPSEAPIVRAATGDFIADAVLGQLDFESTDGQAPSATTLRLPWGIAIDQNSNRLYVADWANNRVLSWPSAKGFTNGQAADIVFGQPDFSTTTQPICSGSTTNTAFRYPNSIAVDSQGSLYVANCYKLLRFDNPTTDQVVDQVYDETTVPSLTSSQTFWPSGVVIGPNDALYILDFYATKVVRIPNPRSANPVADAFYDPPIGGYDAEAMTVDKNGAVYIADYKYNRVLAYTNTNPGTHILPDRVFGATSVAAPGTPRTEPATNKTIGGSFGMATDRDGNLYVADTGNHRILFFATPMTGDSVADAVFGQPDFSTQTPNTGAQGLAMPYGVAVDNDGNVYVTDAGNNRVLRYDKPFPTGQPRITGLRPATAAATNQSLTLTVGGTFVAGATVRWNEIAIPTTFVSANRLVAQVPAAMLASAGQAKITVAQAGAVSPAQLFTIYTAVMGDTTADRVLGQPDFSGESSNSFGLDSASLSEPSDIAVDSVGRLYVADRFNNRVLVWNTTTPNNAQPADFIIGQSNGFVGDQPSDPSQGMELPEAIAVDSQNNLYVVDRGNRVLVYRSPTTTDTVVDLVIGQPNLSSAGCNTNDISASSLCYPQDVAIDRNNNLYVADSSNNRVLVFTNPLASDAIADYVIGQPNFTTNTKPEGVTNRSINNPSSLAVDSAGNLFVGENSYYVVGSGQERTVRVIEFDSPLTTDVVADRVFGQPDMNTGTPNTGGVSATSLASAWALNVDQNDNLYVADGGNRRVLMYRAPLSTDAAADLVFGQPNFASSAQAAPSNTTLSSPVSLAVDKKGNLFIGEWFTNRVLGFDAPLAEPQPTPIDPIPNPTEPPARQVLIHIPLAQR